MHSASPYFLKGSEGFRGSEDDAVRIVVGASCVVRKTYKAPPCDVSALLEELDGLARPAGCAVAFERSGVTDVRTDAADTADNLR